MNEKLENYQRLLENLPNWCESVTSIDGFREKDLELILSEFQIFSKKTKIKLTKGAPYQECHAVSAYLWKNRTGYRIVTGLAYSEELNESLSDWHYHSFCIDEKNTIIEPTPIERNWYVGTILNNDQAEEFYREEIENIRNLFPGKRNNKIK